MKTIYIYVLDTMADWELGYAAAELRSQRYAKKPKEWQVRTVGATKRPIVTMGGMTIVPDASVEEILPEETILLILPGADTWSQPLHHDVVAKAEELLGSNVAVAAICGATAALAEAGIFDAAKHTSNGLPYLTMMCPSYKGSELYQEELAVTDGNLITAGSSAPVEFAYHIFKKLGVFEPEHLEYWYGYFGKHSTTEFMKLLEATQPRS